MVTIASVEAGSVCDKLGLRAGDSLVAINSHEIYDILDYRFHLCDKKIKLTILRDGKTKNFRFRKEENDLEIGLEFAGGSLGMGIGVAVGIALAAKRFEKKYKTYVLLGDGESNEGSVWEAFMSASQYKLDNLVVIVDYDNMQFDGRNDNIMSLAPLRDKLIAFGFETVEVDGHDIEALWNALNTEHVDKPLAIIAKTLKAHGVPSLEDTAESHYASLTDDDYEFLLKSLDEEEKA